MTDLSTRDWLLSAAPTTRRQARLGALYQGWLTFRSNRLAMLGLIILVLLALMAILAPYLAPYSPTAQNLADRGELRGSLFDAAVERVMRVVLTLRDAQG